MKPKLCVKRINRKDEEWAQEEINKYYKKLEESQKLSENYNKVRDDQIKVMKSMEVSEAKSKEEVKEERKMLAVPVIICPQMNAGYKTVCTTKKEEWQLIWINQEDITNANLELRGLRDVYTDAEDNENNY